MGGGGTASIDGVSPESFSTASRLPSDLLGSAARQQEEALPLKYEICMIQKKETAQRKEGRKEGGRDGEEEEEVVMMMMWLHDTTVTAHIKVTR